MKKFELPLFVLLLTALLAIAYWSFKANDRTHRDGPAASSESSLAAESGVEAQVMPAARPAGDQAGTSSPPPVEAATSPSEGRQVIEFAGAALKGRVALPRGSPADETLRIIALANPSSADDVYGSDGILVKLAKGERGGVLGTTKVAVDGSFSLDLQDAERAWLAIDGRFLLSPTLTRVQPGDSPVLTGELAAAVTGRVIPPDGAAMSPEALTAVTLELGPDGERLTINSAGLDQLFERVAVVDGEGRFEFRAVPTAHAMSLGAKSEEAARWRQGALELEPGRVFEQNVTLEAGASLSGRVLAPAGTPVSAAKVTAARGGMWGFPGEGLATTVSDEDGAFTLKHVPAGRGVLVAKQEGYLESEPRTLELHNGQRVDELVLQLADGDHVAGRVIAPDGTAVADIEVEVDFDPAALMGMGAMNAARGARGKGRTDGQGRFDVGGLGKGPFRLLASKKQGDETLRAKLSGVAPGTVDLELVLTTPGRITGRVVDTAGAPVTRFLVRATSPAPIVYMPGTSRDERVDDAKGTFTLADLEAGPWKVEVQAEGFGPSAPVDVEVPLPAATEPLEIVLAPAASVAGLVLDTQGAPVSGARVAPQLALGDAIQRLRGEGAQIECHSDDEGLFLLTGLGSGSLSIAAQHGGFAASEPATVNLEPGQRAENVVLRLRRGALVTGEVWGSDGELAGGVRIVAQGQATMETALEQTDGRGAFRLENLRPGSWTITAMLVSQEDLGSGENPQAALFENMRFTMVEVDDGEELHVVLGAPPKAPVVVHGQVQHGDDPVNHGMVSFMPEGGKGFESLKMATLDAEGRYRVELNEPGKYLVSVQVTGTAMEQQNVERRETIPETDDHELDLELPLGGIRGLVRGADGKPLANAPLTLGSDDGISSGTFMGGHYAQTTTDAGGHYTFDYLRPGSYAIAAGGALFGGALGNETFGGRVVRSGFHVREGEVLEGVDFRLEKPGDVAGRVVDTAGSGVAGASIYVRDGDGKVVDRFTMIASGADGSFKYVGLAPGRYTASARAKDLASAESASFRVESGRASEVTLQLTTGTVLLVEVLDSSGEPAQAMLSVIDDQGRSMEGLLGMSEMSRVIAEGLDGKLHRIGPVPPGTYEVSASVGKAQVSRSVTLTGQAERRLKLRLRD